MLEIALPEIDNLRILRTMTLSTLGEWISDLEWRRGKNWHNSWCYIICSTFVFNAGNQNATHWGMIASNAMHIKIRFGRECCVRNCILIERSLHSNKANEQRNFDSDLWHSLHVLPIHLSKIEIVCLGEWPTRNWGLHLISMFGYVE